MLWSPEVENDSFIYLTGALSLFTLKVLLSALLFSFLWSDAVLQHREADLEGD